MRITRVPTGYRPCLSDLKADGFVVETIGGQFIAYACDEAGAFMITEGADSGHPKTFFSTESGAREAIAQAKGEV